MTENYSDLETENQGNWNPVNRKGVEHVHITEAMICKRDACLKSERTRSRNKNSERWEHRNRNYEPGYQHSCWSSGNLTYDIDASPGK